MHHYHPQLTMAKQLIAMQRASVSMMIDNVIRSWEQTAGFFEGATWFPEEGRKAVGQWVDLNKKACESLKSTIDSGYSNLEKIFSTIAQEEQHGT